MKKQTITSIAKSAGRSPSTIKRWRAAGIDVFSQAALKSHMAQQTTAREPSTLTAERLRKTKLEADRLELSLKMIRGELLDRDTVTQKIAAIAHVINAFMRAASSELPPLLTGLEPHAIEKVLKDWMHGWALRLKDAEDEVWKAANRKVLSELRGDARRAAMAAMKVDGSAVD